MVLLWMLDFYNFMSKFLIIVPLILVLLSVIIMISPKWRSKVIEKKFNNIIIKNGDIYINNSENNVPCCERCGNKIDAGLNYCNHCGKELK